MNIYFMSIKKCFEWNVFRLQPNRKKGGMLFYHKNCDEGERHFSIAPRMLASLMALKII
jgi:hypothetical protein